MQKLNGVVAAGHQETALAGLAMFPLGGNAFDAAVASMLAACVAEPGLTSLGGGGFLLAHTHTNQNILFDFFTQTPSIKQSKSQVDFYPVDVNFGGSVQEFHIGLGSMAVPGVAAGVFKVHQTLGKLPLKVVAEPAINLAKNGLEINTFQAYTFNPILSSILLSSPEGREIYAPQGSILQAGERIVMKNLANTLEYLVQQGFEEFYQGEIARQLVADCQQGGGYLTEEDLRRYRVIERQPLRIGYRGKQILTNPPPSSGGTLIGLGLELLSGIEVANLEFGSCRHLRMLADVMRLTNTVRKQGFDDRLHEQNMAAEFLSPEHLQPYLQELQETVNKWGSTTHISVVDSEGNAASVTTSNGEGSGYMIPGTGIMINNMLGEEDLNPHGFHEWRENVRLSSMMAPTLILDGDRLEMVIGSGGSNRIRTAILQVISNYLDFGMSLAAAVNRPRVHWENYRFDIEPGFNQTEINHLQLADHSEIVQWGERNMFFGGVNGVATNADGTILGTGDIRRSGVSLAI
ncbi:MAG: gamma-glutamyltransferase [Limnospira sp. PMC 1291.21]|uniref:gamma-glutamyltransferase n=1 Tax=unclassified Limnospira TaxID=2642885 RepID=UPI0028E1599E|nr:MULTISPECIES: gamma-glutamyltransferase [unclassified Limnospira]MDT9191841.1 gamma-glutamyltransferase [Limnospira sp. PMC 1245.20]MDT9202100.1 gamma-glutamyltransferase [Limnospira sp. PMC 1243.20]MDT9207230.1 gamma-glutamyltransferase [Limnospira sp. PMC 1252.20]MDT9217522.1 gamma-glutamyltransferase [Limnospira sp. PMC 1240.20]MDT9222669.1 gamma-glutamyltransferase [Limnospira sp. PMC 1279.21]